LLVDQEILSVESGALVEPACSGLVAASPVAPVGVVVAGFGLVPDGGEQACRFGDGQRDHAGFGWWPLIGCVRWRGLGVGAGFEVGGGDHADGQGGHDQHGVPGDRGVKAGLALIEAEGVLGELERFFSVPPVMYLNRVIPSHRR